MPNSTADDYDFALFGPLNDCGGITAGPVRCSYGANTAAFPNTGMNSTTNTATNTNVCGVNNSGADDTEGGCGNGWVNSLNVNTGETYMLLVSKWTPGGSGFNLAWSLTNGASLDCSVTPLPIELLSFSAKAAKGEVKLAWITAAEINNDYFTIERSRDGENFESIIVVDGAGNSTQQLLYQSIDGEPLNGISYYRLKQTDYDGKFSYSDVVPVRFDAKQELFYLQPNPARDRVEVVFTASEDGRNHIRVTNYNGQIVYDRETDVHAGVNRHPVDIGSLPSGIYFVTLENEVEILQMRLVKD
ncbi:MAG: T9SS type A sorting domain-containing protein [Candidatus Pollutiaquabacter aromativorans]